MHDEPYIPYDTPYLPHFQPDPTMPTHLPMDLIAAQIAQGTAQGAIKTI